LSFIDQALVSGGNFTAGILMARAFGLYEFGRFTLIWMGVEFLMSLQFVSVLQPISVPSRPSRIATSTSARWRPSRRFPAL
jgi:hypothetical protein